MDFTKIVATYVKMRDALAEKRKAFEKEEAAIKDQMKVLENALLGHLLDVKSNSVATDAGTFYKTEEIKPSCNDWDGLYRWIAENNEFEALERRIKKTFVADYMAANEGRTPPGVTVVRENVVRIRRA